MADGLYSATGLADESGNLVEAYQYDAYGRQTVIRDGADGDAIVNFTTDDVRVVGGASVTGNAHLFTGQRYDAETGLFHYKARAYDASLGRFLGRDPIADDPNNLYRYVGNSPTNATDPSGLKRVTFYVVFENDFFTWTSSRYYSAGTTAGTLTEWIPGVSTGYTIVGKDVPDVVAQMKAKLSPGDEIVTITFAGHGSPGGWWGGAKGSKKEILTHVDLIDFDEGRASPPVEALRELRPFMTSSSNVRLLMCYQATKNTGKDFMKKVARHIGAPVTGYTGSVEIVPLGECVYCVFGWQRHPEY